MLAHHLRGLTTPLTSTSIVYVELPSGDVVPIEDHRLHVQKSEDGTSYTTHLILMTEAEQADVP